MHSSPHDQLTQPLVDEAIQAEDKHEQEMSQSVSRQPTPLGLLKRTLDDYHYPNPWLFSPADQFKRAVVYREIINAMERIYRDEETKSESYDAVEAAGEKKTESPVASETLREFEARRTACASDKTAYFHYCFIQRIDSYTEAACLFFNIPPESSRTIPLTAEQNDIYTNIEGFCNNAREAVLAIFARADLDDETKVKTASGKIKQLKNDLERFIETQAHQHVKLQALDAFNIMRSLAANPIERVSTSTDFGETTLTQTDYFLTDLTVEQIEEFKKIIHGEEPLWFQQKKRWEKKCIKDRLMELPTLVARGVYRSIDEAICREFSHPPATYRAFPVVPNCFRVEYKIGNIESTTYRASCPVPSLTAVQTDEERLRIAMLNFQLLFDDKKITAYVAEQIKLWGEPPVGTEIGVTCGYTSLLSPLHVDVDTKRFNLAEENNEQMILYSRRAMAALRGKNDTHIVITIGDKTYPVRLAYAQANDSVNEYRRREHHDRSSHLISSLKNSPNDELEIIQSAIRHLQYITALGHFTGTNISGLCSSLQQITNPRQISKKFLESIKEICDSINGALTTNSKQEAHVLLLISAIKYLLLYLNDQTAEINFNKPLILASLKTIILEKCGIAVKTCKSGDDRVGYSSDTDAALIVYWHLGDTREFPLDSNAEQSKRLIDILVKIFNNGHNNWVRALNSGRQCSPARKSLADIGHEAHLRLIRAGSRSDIATQQLIAGLIKQGGEANKNALMTTALPVAYVAGLLTGNAPQESIEEQGRALRARTPFELSPSYIVALPETIKVSLQNLIADFKNKCSLAGVLLPSDFDSVMPYLFGLTPPLEPSSAPITLQIIIALHNNPSLLNITERHVGRRYTAAIQQQLYCIAENAVEFYTPKRCNILTAQLFDSLTRAGVERIETRFLATKRLTHLQRILGALIDDIYAYNSKHACCCTKALQLWRRGTYRAVCYPTLPPNFTPSPLDRLFLRLIRNKFIQHLQECWQKFNDPTAQQTLSPEERRLAFIYGFSRAREEQAEALTREHFVDPKIASVMLRYMPDRGPDPLTQSVVKLMYDRTFATFFRDFIAMFDSSFLLGLFVAGYYALENLAYATGLAENRNAEALNIWRDADTIILFIAGLTVLGNVGLAFMRSCISVDRRLSATEDGRSTTTSAAYDLSAVPSESHEVVVPIPADDSDRTTLLPDHKQEKPHRSCSLL